MVRRPRAFLMVTVLVLGGILLTMGLAYLTGLVKRQQTTSQMVLDLQAQELARAGLEEVRVKMNLDLHFPPRGAVGQEVFSYSESLRSPEGSLLGYYDVDLDRSYLGSGYEVLIITVTGRLPSPQDLQKTLARHGLRAYVEVHRPESGPIGPHFWQVVRFQDLGTR